MTSGRTGNQKEVGIVGDLNIAGSLGDSGAIYEYLYVQMSNQASKRQQELSQLGLDGWLLVAVSNRDAYFVRLEDNLDEVQRRTPEPSETTEERGRHDSDDSDQNGRKRGHDKKVDKRHRPG